VNHRLDYLRKVVSHKVIDCTEEFREYDTKGLAEIMTPSDVRSMPTLRSLPVHLRGLGMPRLLGPEHARHAIVARLRVRNYLITYYPQLGVVHEVSMPLSEEQAPISSMKVPSWRQKNRTAMIQTLSRTSTKSPAVQ
jgi:hypothetical protein